MYDDEHVHVLGAKNGWVDCSTHLLLLAAGEPRRERHVCGAKCLKTSLPYYHMHVQAKGDESSPGRGLQELFAVAVGYLEEGGVLNSRELLGRGRRFGKVAKG